MQLIKLPAQGPTVALAITLGDGKPASTLLRRSKRLCLGDSIKDEVPIPVVRAVGHALWSRCQLARDVAALFEHCAYLCFPDATRTVEQTVLQRFVRGSGNVGVTQPHC